MNRATGDRPNVIVFFTDQQRHDSMAAHGNPLGITPNLDRIAHRHAHVFNSFTCQPVCCPARSCLQTGKYATATGCYRNGIPMRQEERTLAKCFTEGGYQTGYIGKWHLGDDAVKGPVSPELRGGYDYWLAAQALEHTSDAYHCVLYDNDGAPVKLPGYRVDAMTDAAIRYVDRHKADPFFLFLSYLEPHHQNCWDDYPPPDGYREPYSGRWIPPDLAELKGSAHQHLGGYWGMIKRLDEAYGRLHDALKSLGLDRNTIVLFTSDHACHFRTRNGEYKRSCHESSIRVPTVFSGPGFEGAGAVRELVSLVDLPPTLLEAAHLPVPDAMQGRSIMPLLRGDRSQWPGEVYVQISESQVARAVRTHRWKYCVNAPDKDGNKNSCSEMYVEQALYDLQHDPHELRNLVDVIDYEPVRVVMRQRMLRRMQEAGEAPATIRPVEQKRRAAHLTITPEAAQA